MEKYYGMNIRKRLQNPYLIFVLGCLLGSLVFVCIYGLAVVNVTNVAWLTDSSQAEGLWDLTQHYLGWVFYRKSPWHFPLGLVEGIYSQPVSIVYTDSIPLFALLFKILSPLLPANFQYFGLFELLSYALMGGFGALFVRAFSKRSQICLLSSLFFVLSPVMLKRTFYHTALSAHFLILAAFCLWVWRGSLLPEYASTERETTGQIIRRRWRYAGRWIILLCLSALTNAYFTPMILGIWLCSDLQEYLAKAGKKDKGLLVIYLVEVLVAGLILFGICYIMGYFYGEVSVSTTGLEELSFNLLQFFDPSNDLCVIDHRNYIFSKQNYSSLLPTLPTVSGWQEEGFAYLGFGMIFLLACLVVYGSIRWITGKYRKRHEGEKAQIGQAQKTNRRSWIISILVGFLVFTFLALSPRASLGSRILYQISYPQVIYQALSVFRSTGRLIWPVYYGLLALGIYGMVFLLERSRGRFSLGFLIGLLVLQVYDLYPGVSYKHQAYTYAAETGGEMEASQSRDTMTAAYKKYLSSDVWDMLGDQMDEIVFYPPTQFGIECDPKTSCIFEEYALAHAMSLNVTYMSRDMSRTADQKTYAHFEKRKEGEKFTHTLYIFFDISDIPPSEETHLQYYQVDGYVIGVEKSLIL